MLKLNLAQQLRERQYDLNEVSREVIDQLSDDEIISAYITCSECDKKIIEGVDLIDCINDSKNVKDFLIRTSNHSC